MKKPYAKHHGGKNMFWNQEYKKGQHLTLSTNQSEDLEKFIRWLERETGKEHLNPTSSVLDLGTGNGRNILYLAREFGVHGIGYDISSEAISQAKKAADGLPIEFFVRSIKELIPVPDESQDIVLDMMTSHFLRATEREQLLNEMYRVLKPGGWFFWKTFLLEGDANAERMLRDYPADEPGSYIHPRIGALEHVWTEEEAVETIAPKLEIKKITKSHGHLRKSGAKRRSICVYAQKVF